VIYRTAVLQDNMFYASLVHALAKHSKLLAPDLGAKRLNDASAGTNNWTNRVNDLIAQIDANLKELGSA
jgi:hypothetical protein